MESVGAYQPGWSGVKVNGHRMGLIVLGCEPCGYVLLEKSSVYVRVTHNSGRTYIDPGGSVHSLRY
jgi:hypothetical protein